MRVVIIGATGVIGQYVVPRLVERGNAVRAIVVHPERAGWLSLLGVEVVRGKILDRLTLRGMMAGCEAAINVATSIPRPGQGGDFAVNDRIRREGTRHFLEECAEGGAGGAAEHHVSVWGSWGGDR